MSGRISGGFHPCYYGLHAHIRPSVAAREWSVSCQSQNIACYCIPWHVEVVPAGLGLYNGYWSLVGLIGWVMGESRSVLLRFEHQWGDLRSFPCTNDLIEVVYLCGTGVKWKLRLMCRLQGSWHGILNNDWTWQSLTCTLTFPPGPTSFNITLEQQYLFLARNAPHWKDWWQIMVNQICHDQMLIAAGHRGIFLGKCILRPWMREAPKKSFPSEPLIILQYETSLHQLGIWT